MKNLHLLFSALFMVSLVAPAQKQANHWYFGPGLDFSNGAPVPDNGGRPTPAGIGEGCSVISDDNGNLLFYTYNQDTIYNKLHQPMANGTYIHSNVSSVQPSLILKKPGSASVYYLFTQTGLGPNWSNVPTGLYYNEIDMSLAGGNGSVTVKNAPVDTSSTTGMWESLSAVQHCNGIDYWVLVRELNPANQYKAYLVTAAGVSMTPVVSTVGPAPQNTWQGMTKFSPTGRKVAVTCFAFNVQNPFILDFDPATGLLSNPLVLDTYGIYVEFSPDGTKLYSNGTDGQNMLFNQWDLCAGTTSASVINSRYTQTVQPSSGFNFGNFQLAPDGKIYATSLTSPVKTASVSVINNPNAPGAGCNFVYMGQSIGNRFATWALPNFVSSYFKTVSSSISYTTGSCSNVLFSSPPFSTVTCSAVNPYTGVTWIFGDPGSGTANTSTLSSPSHVYGAPGTYQVKLALHNACAADTIYQTLTIAPNSTLQSTQSKTVCLNEKVVLTASPANSYSWSNGATSSSITVSVLTSSVYVVTSTLTGGCTSSTSFSITASECTGLSKGRSPATARIYPVPAHDRLTVEMTIKAAYTLTDVTGRVILSGHLVPGAQEIDCSALNSGLYVISIDDGVSRLASRVVVQR